MHRKFLSLTNSLGCSVTRNIKTPPMQRIGSKAGPAEDPNPAPTSLTETGVKTAPVAQIERIADAMAAETIEFVAFLDGQARTTLRQARE